MQTNTRELARNDREDRIKSNCAMASFTRIICVTMFVICVCDSVRSMPDMTAVQSTCDGEQYQQYASYDYNVGQVVEY